MTIIFNKTYEDNYPYESVNVSISKEDKTISFKQNKNIIIFKSYIWKQLGIDLYNSFIMHNKYNPEEVKIENNTVIEFHKIYNNNDPYQPIEVIDSKKTDDGLCKSVLKYKQITDDIQNIVKIKPNIIKELVIIDLWGI